MRMVCSAALIVFSLLPSQGGAQTPPSAAEIAAYQGLHKAVALGHHTSITELLVNGLKPDLRDGHGRTALHVAAHRGDIRAMELLVKGGADPNALDSRRYDIVTILAVRDDAAGLDAALKLGASAKNVTSPYDGTALIAAAHLGHHASIRLLIAAGAPLDHVNNLKWTAVIEAIVLGDGERNHQESLRLLLDAGADPNLADGNGKSPLALARERGFRAMEAMLLAKGAR